MEPLTDAQIVETILRAKRTLFRAPDEFFGPRGYTATIEHDTGHVTITAQSARQALEHAVATVRRYGGEDAATKE